ncbi:MAG TPA: hypothetical protein VIK88_01020, partial [Candidatus Bathyarchaeia archaeon]
NQTKTVPSATRSKRVSLFLTKWLRVLINPSNAKHSLSSNARTPARMAFDGNQAAEAIASTRP